jgi:selenocysteine lyase/cysteine desulfurase
MNDDLAITALLHKYEALAFWDYACAAPYVNIDMNPKASPALSSTPGEKSLFPGGDL